MPEKRRRKTEVQDSNNNEFVEVIHENLKTQTLKHIAKFDLIRQHCRLGICFVLVEFDKSETNPNNNLMMRPAGLS